MVRAIGAAACAATLAMPGCASAPFTLRYCEDGAAGVTSCGCAPAAREVAGGRVGRVEVHETAQMATGLKERRYQVGPELPFVLRGRWLVLEVVSRAPSASLQTWLRCGDRVIPGEVAHRATIREPGGSHAHQFLALFSGAPDPDELATPVCRMHVVLGPTEGLGLTRMVQRVYFVGRTSTPPVPGMTWGVPIAGEPALAPVERRARLEPPVTPPQPRLCRVGGPVGG